VLFANRQHSFTLDTFNADSDAGLPDQYEAIRRRMIDLGYWRRRDELHEQDTARAERMKLEVQRWKSTRPASPLRPFMPSPSPSLPPPDGEHEKRWQDFLKRHPTESDTEEEEEKAGQDVADEDVEEADDDSADNPSGGQLSSIVLNNELLDEIGLGDLLAKRKKTMLKYIYDTLELRVGTELANQMSDEQLEEFEAFSDNQDDQGAFHWLESNFPEYKQVVKKQFGLLKEELRDAAPRLLAADDEDD
jgi:hypothetical protein